MASPRNRLVLVVASLGLVLSVVGCSSEPDQGNLAPPASAPSSFVNWETPHVHPLDLTADRSRLLVVNLPDNRLEVFDSTGGLPELARSIPVGLDPVSVRARTNDEAWVVNHISDSVSVVDLATGNVTATLQTEDEPCDVVFSSGKAFVTCSQANTVLVFDVQDLSRTPERIEIRGEDPRAMAVGPGGEVYVAVFESGNGTTVLGGGILPRFEAGVWPPNVVNDPVGPYGGVNPPPNDGASFSPPIEASLPVPPMVSLIVRRNGVGRWLDDNDGDWTSLVSGQDAGLSGRPIGWELLDHDVAVIDPDSFDTSYVGGLANLCMAIDVNPETGVVSVVGTDATNEVRFEPVLNGRFLRVQLGLHTPGGSNQIVDLNRHLDYSTSTVPQLERDLTVSDPRGITWNRAGTKAYVTGMGTNNVVVLDGAGARTGLAPTIEVGEGPTGVALDEVAQRLYVLNKFESSISVIDTTSELEVARVPFYDPTPLAIRVGRKHLYDAHATSGLGLTACASCHADARMDRLAWDLGNPEGAMKSVEGQNLGANAPGLGEGFEDWHPMKGPTTTQTLQDIIGLEPHHWRGDRDGLEEFNGAFLGLLGDDEPLKPEEMQAFEDFLATIHYPPNPFRNLDNSLPTELPLPGHFTTGRFAPAGNPLPPGNAERGETLYHPPSLTAADNQLACATCHTRPTGAGPDLTRVDNSLVPIPPGPNGERHLALVATDGTTNVTMKVPQLRNVYEKVGFDATQAETLIGFGFSHDGSIDSLARFLSEPNFTLASVQDVADLVAFLLCFSGDSAPRESTDVLEPPGPASQDTPASVGRQLTLGGAPTPSEEARLDAMLLEAESGRAGLVVKGRQSGLQRGWSYSGGTLFLSDRAGEVATWSELIRGARLGSERTFTLVPSVSSARIGIDRDEDGFLDRDELDVASDPADPASRPQVRLAPQIGSFAPPRARR